MLSQDTNIIFGSSSPFALAGPSMALGGLLTCVPMFQKRIGNQVLRVLVPSPAPHTPYYKSCVLPQLAFISPSLSKNPQSHLKGEPAGVLVRGVGVIRGAKETPKP